VLSTYGVQRVSVVTLLVWDINTYSFIFAGDLTDVQLGFLPPLMSVTFVRVISFSTYQNVKYRISDEYERITGVSPLVYYNQTGSIPSLATISTFTIAGMCAGLAASPFACEWIFFGVWYTFIKTKDEES
jgi:hypothetical protein